jgi:hypothetical protein
MIAVEKARHDNPNLDGDGDSAIFYQQGCLCGTRHFSNNGQRDLMTGSVSNSR